MTSRPYPFLITAPFVFTLLVCLGLSRPSFIEEDVSNLWIPIGGSYKQDRDYVENVGGNEDETSTFAAMALSRHGGNLFQEVYLNAIIDRMKLIENTQVSYKGINYSWNDICFANGLSHESTYQMPCLRLSPMDLFQEARWYFTEDQRVTWYDEVKGVIIKPLVIRYGILQDRCITPAESTACDHAKNLRSDPDYAVEHGYPATSSGAATDLLHDIFGMELNDPCRICIENSIEEHLRQLTDDYVIPAFTTLTQQLRRLLFALEEQDDVRTDTVKHVGSLIKKTASIATKVSRDDVEDFYMHYIIRNLYADGADKYQEIYRQVNDPMYRGFICGYDDLVCPPEDVTLEEARETLLRHADNMFSSYVTFGAPFPFWSSPEGNGHLFAGSFPVGGSGINMSAPLDSLATYLDLEHREDNNNWRPFFYDNRRQDGVVDPLGDDYLWETMVATNPIYAWFMAGETEMTAHCGNQHLLGTNISDITIDTLTAELMKDYSLILCTKYNAPYEQDGTRTQQHFARMWFDLLIDSPFVLNITKGDSDPYTWTSGAGCGYELGFTRFSYTEQPEETILQNASGELYNIDEGAEIGVVDRSALIGDAHPPVGEYSFDNPLEHVGLLQTIYVTLLAADIAERVQHKNRPGGPLNITEDDAREVLSLFKASFESLWTDGWDDEDSEVQFVGFFDDAAVRGTIGRFLKSVTLSSGRLIMVAIVVIAVFSAAFLARRNPIESRVGITLFGVVLVVLAFFASVGLSTLIGIKVNLTIAWTLPLIMIGMGVDNVFVILLALTTQDDNSKKAFFKGMKEVAIPITIRSLVNLSMFAALNVNAIPEVYLTARVACIAIVLLFLGTMLCFPAYCYLDLQRQDAGRRDVFVWKQCESTAAAQKCEKPLLERLLYDRFYHPLFFGESYIRVITHSLIWACAALLLAFGLYGISISTFGLGLEDFLPPYHQGHTWASARTDLLGSWVLRMNWPEVDYGLADTQMKIIRQFERAVDTPYIVEIDTRKLWIAEMATWTTRQCDYSTALEPSEERVCGRDQFFDAESTCSGTWKRNKYGLRQKNFAGADQCQPYDGGVCRPTSEMHPDDLRDLGVDPVSVSAENLTESWCPVFEGWSQEKMAFCVRKWYEHVDGTGQLLIDEDAECDGEFCDDYIVKVPIVYSSGPPMTAKGVVSHELTLLMMKQTRAVCDQDEELRCWMSGPPFDFWSQYEGIQLSLVITSGTAVLIGFVTSWILFSCKLFYEERHPPRKVLCGSLAGALVIAANCCCCLVAVVGISILSGVSLTAFSLLSFVMSLSCAAEYGVHVVSCWLSSDHDSALQRSERTMSFLIVPTFMSFVSSTAGVICLAFTDFEFYTKFFFRPLIIVKFVTYFFSCLWLPVFLAWLDFDFVKLGSNYAGLGESSGSLLSRIQLFESSQAEVGRSSGSDAINESSDFETTLSSLPTNMTKSMRSTRGENECRSLEFLPSYNMAGCGDGFGEQKFDDSQSAHEIDEGSFPPEMQRPLPTDKSEEEGNPSEVRQQECEDYSAVLPPLLQAKPDPPVTKFTNANEIMELRPAPMQRSSPSEASSQKTNKIKNTGAALLCLYVADDVRRNRFKTETNKQTSAQLSGEAIQRNSLDVVSMAASIDTASRAEVASSSSNLFEGIDVVPATDDKNADLSPLQHSLSVAPMALLQAPRPEGIRPPTRTNSEVRLGSACTGGILHPDAPHNGVYDVDDLPPVRQSHSSSPCKKVFPISPLRLKSKENDLNSPSARGLLNARASDQHRTGRGGYDFGHVLDGWKILDVGSTEAPQSNREVLRGMTGEVLSIHAVFEGDESHDTIHF